MAGPQARVCLPLKAIHNLLVIIQARIGEFGVKFRFSTLKINVLSILPWLPWIFYSETTVIFEL